MRCLKRNKRTIYYALYKGKTPVIDESGYRTGEYTLSYDSFKPLEVNVSAGKGESYVEAFGQNLVYDRIIVVDDVNCPISEDTILCIDITPDGTSNLYDYVVKKVARSLNSVSYAISKVDVS